MTDLNPVARQWKLEAEAARLGAERLRVKTREMEEKAYSSGTVWGEALVRQQVMEISKRIVEKKARLTQGKAQPHGIQLWDCLELIEPEVLAAIAAKKTLDLIGLGKDNTGKYNNTYTNVCHTIGAAIESEARFRWYEHTAGKEWKACKAKYFKPTTGTRQKEIVSRTIMNRRGYRWASWTNPKKVHVGAFMLDRIAEIANWFVFEKRNLRGKKDALHLVQLSPQLKDIKDHLMAMAELQAPLTWPMLCEPTPWSNKDRGGYLTNELRQGFSLVRRQRGPLTLGNTPIDMLNNLQQVAYRVNPITHGLMKQLESRSMDLGSFVLRDNEAPIPRPDTQDDEVLFDWRKQRTEQENRNAALHSKRYRTLETIITADRFHSEERIYIPWSFDYRGRVYPLVSFMSPQGTDMEKSLYLFADSRPVTEDAKRWLAIHLANTAGQDKLTMDERVAWTQEHHEMITAIANDPLGNLHHLEGFDEPWCGLAACAEYHACVIACTQATTSLPVATDATCSGLQHLAALTLDGETGALVNVKPGPAPQDAYKAVLNETLRLLREPTPDLLNWAADRNDQRLAQWHKDKEAGKDVSSNPPAKLVLPNEDLAKWGEEVGRKLAKRVVMTVPYAATPHSNRGYIKEAIEEHQEELERATQEEIGRVLKYSEKRRPSGADLSIYTHVMLYAMERVVPGPIAVMNWIKDTVKGYFDSDPDGCIQYVTPSGFPVLQDKRFLDIRRVKTQLLGEVVKSEVCVGTKGVNVNKHRSCSAPNFIHSMDASLLHLSFAGFDKPFILIHDSILTTATDMSYMSMVIRDEFVKIYKDHPLLNLSEALRAEVPHGLFKGDLDITHCQDSVYFFC
jgi:DNA-directed RNA polymerase